MEKVLKYESILNKKVDFSKIPDINETKYSALIIEPRKHQYLSLVLKNFMFMLNYNNKKLFSLIIYHSKHNETYIKKILGKKHKVKCICFTEKESITIDEYNQLLYSIGFWNSIPTEKVLIFQTDTFIRKPNIEDFLKYDYIGAPWKYGLYIGNGGLSLRTVSFMKKCLINYGFLSFNFFNEDTFFSFFISFDNDILIPTIDIAKQFSVESVYYNDPMGWHKAYYHLSESDFNSIANCPILDNLIKLK